MRPIDRDVILQNNLNRIPLGPLPYISLPSAANGYLSLYKKEKKRETSIEHIYRVVVRYMFDEIMKL